MDSLTQLTLGAAVGEAVAGKKTGNRAMVAGAIFGTLPDLDVIVPFADAVAGFTYHRSFSHSWLVLSALTPILAMTTLRFVPAVSFRRWCLLIFLTLNTHVLLDCFTVYGTQALWPLSNYPVGWSTIFIIDPLYTVPLLAGIVISWRSRVGTVRRKRANAVGLTLSSFYLLWTVVAHGIAEQRAISELATQHVQYQTIHTTPTPFSLLWRFIARDTDSYLEGYHALTDPGRNIQFTRYRSNEHLYELLKDHWPVERLKWFTNNHYAMHDRDDVVYMTDLRMGIEASYVFSFRMARWQDGVLIPEQSELLPFRPDLARLKKVFYRMVDQNISLLPDS